VKQKARGTAKRVVTQVGELTFRPTGVLERFGARFVEKIGEYEVGVSSAALVAGALRTRGGVERGLAGLVHATCGRMTRRTREHRPGGLDATPQRFEEQKRPARGTHRLTELPDRRRCGGHSREVGRFLERSTGACGMLRR
jgi:hypothetical protein